MSAGYDGGHKRQKEVILMAGFHDIIGHDDIIRHLKNAIETGKVSHSYIFTGEAGSGKKLLAGIVRACYKRPISIDRMNEMVDEIETEIFNSGEKEIPTTRIGEVVMDKLKDLDAVAYVRFASVYREFKDVNTFMDELKKFLV